MEKRRAVLWICSLLLQQLTAQIHLPAGPPEGRPTKPLIAPGPSAGILLQDSPGFMIVERQTLHQNVLIDLDPHHTFSRISSGSAMPEEVREWVEEKVLHTQQSVQEMLRQLEKVFVVRPEHHNTRPRRLAGFLISALVMAVVGSVVGTTMSTVNALSISKLDQKIQEMQMAMMSMNHQLSQTSDTLQQVISFINNTAITVNDQSELLEHSTQLHLKNQQEKDNIKKYQEPLVLAANKLLREVQDAVHLLILGKLPLSLISSEFMREILLRHGTVDTLQMALAFEISSSLLTYIDVEMMRIGFVINVPLIYPQNIYNLKTVHNVGVWKNNLMWMIKTPDVVSFHSEQPDLLLVPEMHNCIKFKDVNFLCAGKPFKLNGTQLLCGLKTETEDCLVEVSQPDPDDRTRVILVGHQWLVNSNLKHMTVHYPTHGTNTQTAYPQPVSLVTIPRGVVVTIGDKTLFHVGDETLMGGIELVDTFKGKPLVTDPDLLYLLTHKKNHTLQFNLRETNVTVKNYMYTDVDLTSIAQHYWMTPNNVILLIAFLVLVFWALGVTLQLIINTKRIRRLEIKITDPEVDIIPARWGKIQNTPH